MSIILRLAGGAALILLGWLFAIAPAPMHDLLLVAFPVAFGATFASAEIAACESGARRGGGVPMIERGSLSVPEETGAGRVSFSSDDPRTGDRATRGDR